MELKNSRPSLPEDSEYLNSLAKKIPAKASFGEVKFEYLTDVLTALGISEDPYTYVNLDGNSPELIDSLLVRSFQKLEEASADTLIREKLYRLWDYLAEEDELRAADLILVFGGIELTRMKEAVRLLKEGYAERILFSGKHASSVKKSDVTEAHLYAEEAEKLGVRKDQILLETQAINTPENVLNSVALLTNMNCLPQKVIIVTSPYHLRRAYLTCKAVEAWRPEIIRHGAPSTHHFKDIYFKDERTWSLACLEYLKLYGGRVMKHF